MPNEPQQTPQGTPAASTPSPSATPSQGGSVWEGHSAEPVVTETPPVITTPPPSTETPPTQTPPAATPPAGQPAAQPAMTPEQIAQLAAQAARNVQQQQQAPQQQQPRQYTQAELDQMLNVVRATPETFQRIFGVQPENQAQVDALNDYSQGIVRQAVTMAKFLIEQHIGTMRESITPIQQTVRAQVETQLESEFYTVYPDLKDYRPLLVEIKDGMVARGITFTSKEEAFKAVAEKARQLLAKTGQPGPTANQQPGQVQPTGTVPQMTPTSVGGRVGSPSATPAKTTAQSIFGG